MANESTTRTSKTPTRPRTSAIKAAVWSAVAAAGFSVVVCAVLAALSLRVTLDDPLDSAELRSLQQTLAQTPKDQAAREQFRTLDLQLRGEYFRRRGLMVTGAYMLAGGLGVLFIASKIAATLKTIPPHPSGEADQDSRRTASRSRWATGAAALIVGSSLAAAAIYLTPPPMIEPSRVDDAQPGMAAEPAPQVTADWPSFRGPTGAGTAPDANFTTDWNGASGLGVAWKTEIDLPGHNSPIIAGNRVWVVGADEYAREIYCLDAETGKLLWTHEVEDVPGDTGEAPNIMEDTGHAAPTGVTDGRRFVAIFPNGDVVCVGLEGDLLWARNLGLPDSIYGYSSSLAIHAGRVLVQFDHGLEEDRKSFLYGLDAETGKIEFKAPRPVGSSWASPVVIRAAGRDQLITIAEPQVISHDPATGKILWQVSGIGADVAPSPILAGGLVIAITPNDTMQAIRPDGAGDVTKTHVAWTTDEVAPDICSPVSDGELLFTMSTNGTLTCLDLADGKVLWEHDFETQCQSSPSLVGKTIYAMSDAGVMYFVAAERTFRLIGQAELGEKSVCSPAFVNGRIYIRAKEHLYCIDGVAP